MDYPKLCNWILLKKKADGSYDAKDYRYVLTTKEERIRLLRAGPHGVIELLICCVLVALQVVLPSLYLMYFLEVVECFI